MPLLTQITTIDRPTVDVIDTFFDWTQDTTWRPAVGRMTVHPSEPAVAGQRIVEELRFCGLTFVTPTRVESVHPHRVTWSGGSAQLEIRGWREVEVTDTDSCRATIVVDVRLRGAMRLATPLLALLYRRTMRKDLELLRSHVELSATTRR